MTTATTWVRLEPRPRRADLGRALEAQTADALWNLARQWQVLEFQGEDAASAAAIELDGRTRPVTGFRSGATAKDLDAPIETVVEREARRKWSVLDDLQAGQALSERLTDQGYSDVAAKILAQHPFTAGNVTGAAAALARRCAGVVISGKNAVQALRASQPGLPVAWGIDAGRRAAVEAVVQAWHAWVLRTLRAGGDPAAWDSSRMEYSFAVTAADGASRTTLVADEYPGGRLDWHSFAAGTGQSRPGQGQDISERLLATPVQFAGMPIDRWWEFEDEEVTFAGVEAEPHELAKLALMEFVLVYGNDWLVAPFGVPVGSLTRLGKVRIRDVFGESHEIRPLQAPGFRLWEVDGITGLFIPPVLSMPLEGAPVEEVCIMRDEMANLAWAVEKVTEDNLGRARDRHAQAVQGQESVAPGLQYRLWDQVPDHWIALVPTPGPAGMQLELGEAPRFSGDFTVGAVGVLFGNRPVPFAMEENEVPREGLRLTRNWQAVRDVNGVLHVWMTRRKSTGRGEGSSGLQFDRLGE